jgi:hypothetical protein
MPKRDIAPPKPSNFTTEPFMDIDGFLVSKGDIIKVRGEYGIRFKFIGVTTNRLTGASWVDCFQIFRGSPQQFRAFNKDRISRVPQKGKRAQRV